MTTIKYVKNDVIKSIRIRPETRNQIYKIELNAEDIWEGMHDQDCIMFVLGIGSLFSYSLVRNQQEQDIMASIQFIRL